MIIGITGTNSAGKNTVVDYLVEKKGFLHLSGRKFITEEIVRRGMPVDRNSMNIVGNDLRKSFGPTYISEQLYKQAVGHEDNVVMESIRNIGEAEFVKSHGGLLWGVDADRKIRYERAILRGSGTDKVTFEDFCAQEDREMASTEKYDMNVFGVMKMADIVLRNDGMEEELFTQVEAALKKFAK